MPNPQLPLPPLTLVSHLQGEDNADMKLDFAFDSSELLDDKNKMRAGHIVSSAPSSVANSNILPSTAELNLKIASVKKVWETMPTVLEHTQDDFSSAGFDPSLESSFKEASVDDGQMPVDVVSYSGVQTIVTGGSYATGPGGGLSATMAGKTDPTTTSSNVCKVCWHL